MNDQPDELDPSSLRKDFAELLGRMKELAFRRDATGKWFAQWLPAVGAVTKLGQTMMRALWELKTIVTAGPDEMPPLPTELRDELIADLRQLADDFPDIADVLFGLHHLDALVAALAEDSTARALAQKLWGTLSAMFDGFVARLVELAFDPEQSERASERVVTLVQGFEAVLSRLLDRWVGYLVGLASSASFAQEEEDA